MMHMAVLLDLLLRQRVLFLSIEVEHNVSMKVRVHKNPLPIGISQESPKLCVDIAGRAGARGKMLFGRDESDKMSEMAID
ncbi:hypothetical protein DPMN_051030 [Dreissena polymorpha]|uniref:Uncharacterized protein n=1 Tax=Dreissena polymorpha TaxID=45954 RepID=A0A9D4HLT1_DREPO|nr:hypothetical protein DPMN_051022 [Dreissena polymorpha]KAH3725195.1 hypothetical protein DPMN_051030 [Dreissena polymorpha]